MLDICHLKAKLDTVIRDAHLPDKTASCLQFVTKRFIGWAIRLSTRRQLCHGLKIRHCSLVI